MYSLKLKKSSPILSLLDKKTTAKIIKIISKTCNKSIAKFLTSQATGIIVIAKNLSILLTGLSAFVQAAIFLDF